MSETGPGKITIGKNPRAGWFFDSGRMPDRPVGRLVWTGNGEGVSWEVGTWDRFLLALVEAHRDDPAFAAALERMGWRIEWEQS